MQEGAFLEPWLGRLLPLLYVDSGWWTAFGLIGNALFSSRFVIQWLHSEKKKELVVPPIFWHLSFWGSVISLVYALHVDKLPIILGYAFLPVLYARNLVLLRRGKTPPAKG
ncbi:MAG: lipid-A-disaccharide synthase N-terminal domain-containing protein [Holophagales bacterium]|nr:MAG: lipid-A-disaccharide synthase N-terminal domain-containing protein [Holophagales bacterium]